MKQLKIFYPLITGENNSILRIKSEFISEFSDEIKEFSEILLYLMYEYDGVGLAAPQIGKNIRAIAVTEWREWKKRRNIIWEYVLINPEIIETSITTDIDEEACLSVPNVYGNVERFCWVKIRYFDTKGKRHVKKVSWFNAKIIQHEIDHLDGILFVDKVIPE